MYLLCWKNQFEEGRGGEVNNHGGKLIGWRLRPVFQLE